jgi:hypothetical protein
MNSDYQDIGGQIKIVMIVMSDPKSPHLRALNCPIKHDLETAKVRLLPIASKPSSKENKIPTGGKSDAQ